MGADGTGRGGARGGARPAARQSPGELHVVEQPGLVGFRGPARPLGNGEQAHRLELGLGEAGAVADGRLADLGGQFVQGRDEALDVDFAFLLVPGPLLVRFGARIGLGRRELSVARF